MFCSPVLVFGGTEGDRYRFLILRAQTHFRGHRGRRVLFSCFALSDSFSAVSRASGPIFMLSALGLVFGVTEGDGFRFLVLRFWARFRHYRGRLVPFSCFALPYSFSAAPRASGPIFMFCAPVLVFGGTEGVGSRFHVLRSRTRFGRYQVRRDPFSFVAFPDSFSAVPRATGTVFLCCAPELIFDSSGSVGYRFHVLRAWNLFRRYQGRRVPF
jgi:hypothetical protein